MSDRDLRSHGIVIVPAYNEARALPEVVTDLREHLPDWKILIVDDGSVDATAMFSAPGVRVLHLRFNLGIGGAVQAGYRYAALHGYDYALQVDGDGQHPAEEAPRLLKHMMEQGADMVIGSRFLQSGAYVQSRIRSLGRWMIQLQLWALSGRRFTDCASGYRLVNRRLIRAFSQWYPDDYPEPEVLLHLHRAGCVIEEIPVRMRQRTSGRSSIPVPQGIAYVAKVSFALLLALGRTPWPGVFLQTETTGATLPPFEPGQ